jgi:cytoskeleton protein RodZ
MTELANDAEPVQTARTAGSLLREARQAQGLHIAALSASIKVAQRKLESLEADRLDELPDATFTRALAQTVCRSLKIDPAPVLALLPPPPGHRLEHVSEGLNEPFRDRPGRREPNDWRVLASPAVWGPVLVVTAAAVVYLLPEGWLTSLQPAAPSASAAAAAPSTVSVVVPTNAASEAASASSAAAAVVEPAASTPVATPAAAPAASGATSSAAPLAGPLQLRAHAQSWVEVQDAASQVLMSRLVQPGETVVLDGAMPLRVKIGNATGTELVFRGQALDLASSTRDNVARLELK